MATARRFRDLDVYKMALREAKRLFETTKTFPAEEKYALTDQIRRSSRAVSAMVAEAWARRRYKAAFINKLNQAQAEAAETQTWLDHARLCEYIDQEEYKDLDQAWQYIGGKLERMIQHADRFCSATAQ